MTTGFALVTTRQTRLLRKRLAHHARPDFCSSCASCTTTPTNSSSRHSVLNLARSVMMTAMSSLVTRSSGTASSSGTTVGCTNGRDRTHTTTRKQEMHNIGVTTRARDARSLLTWAALEQSCHGVRKQMAANCNVKHVAQPCLVLPAPQESPDPKRDSSASGVRAEWAPTSNSSGKVPASSNRTPATQASGSAMASSGKAPRRAATRLPV
jgi:hypothetical protein